MINRNWRQISSLFAIFALYSSLGWAERSPSCDNSITSCGCTITRPGLYSVDADLSASQGLTSRRGCIDIDACDVKLFTNGHAITGNFTETGSAIHILFGVWDVFIEGRFGSGSEPVNYSLVSGWRYGLRSAASNVVSGGFNYVQSRAGVLLNGAINNTISNFGADNNSVYGVWIKNGSMQNQILNGGANGNTIAGTFVGCSLTGPTGPSCVKEEDRSRHNYIYTMENLGNGSYGIALEKGSRNNIVTDTSESGNALFDLYDGNTHPSCDHNIWRANTFTTANQTCIQ
ncbi:MAG TPA: hypothetical protein VEL47_04565 [Myxococcota bacterium]|nr:hypothetical protein [Myxococcota bacterium]